MSDQNLVKLAYDLLPGFGLFGPQPPFHKTLKVGGRLDRINLFFDSGGIQEYRFPEIHLFDKNGKKTPIAQVVKSVEATSVGEKKDHEGLKDLLLSGKAIHSGSETRPGLEIRFNEPVYLSRVEFAQNGRSQLIRRARHLCMNGYLNNRIVLAHCNNDPKLRIAALKDVYQALNIPIPHKPLNPEDRKVHCQRVRNAVLMHLDQDASGWNALQLAQFLPVHANSPELTPFRLRVCAETVIATLNKELTVKTQELRILSTLLSTPERLERVVAEVNRLLSARLNRPVEIVASKHRVQEPVLLRMRDSFLKTLDRIFPALKACGATPMLCYGTLLGAVRSNAFIGYDDDVDLLYFDGSRSREEMIAKADKLIEALALHGFKNSFRSNFEVDSQYSVHFGIRDKNVFLDFFPCWQEGSNLRIVTKNRMYYPVPQSMILPTSTVSLYGHEYPAPADPVAFLAERYGAGWSVPDPYHEWPWAFQKTAAVRL